MTAAMVIAHWINMQYFASTVDNPRFGSGNKTLHNVVAGRLGVFEGNDGVGMETGEPKKIVKNRKEHFSGIGVQNVQERLALIYGKREEPDFYIHIDSVPGHGTTIRIRIPNI
jgi:LytS/YehU family sensor histidine kinase